MMSPAQVHDMDGRGSMFGPVIVNSQCMMSPAQVHDTADKLRLRPYDERLLRQCRAVSA